jgi:hypothetical protein
MKEELTLEEKIVVVLKTLFFIGLFYAAFFFIGTILFLLLKWFFTWTNSMLQ